MKQRGLGFGLKWRAALLLAFLLAAVIAVLSLLVLAGIREDQRKRLEQMLAAEAETANLRVRQEALTSVSPAPDAFMELSGQGLAVNLGAESGLPVT
ncbi:hypothetical protein NSQ80_08385 [Paenibacillus sp. FSL K6-2441]|uniref:hypothetical protein n=1 Tax=Paenibacillus sp. FSL K6-2441 TaxID=2954679 RepID=UPI0002FA038C|nr:hypothetical protein [Paenibacillus sp. p3-SID1389]